jgi:hypothetical protein
MSLRSLSLIASAALVVALPSVLLPGARASAHAAPAGAARPAAAAAPVTAPGCAQVATGWRCRLVNGPQPPAPGTGAFSRRNGVSPRANGTPPYGPQDLWSAYNLADPRQLGGNLVALVEAFDYPNLVSDLSFYRNSFGLGGCVSPAARSCTFTNGATLRVLDQLGGNHTAPPDTLGFAQETALDADMISATCPSCSIVVVEANSNTEGDVLRAMDTAVAQSPAEISLSLGRDFETVSDPQENAHFDHGGIAITIAAGDCSFGPGFPATSPGVVSVGGTSLSPANNARGWSESVWEGNASQACRKASAGDPNPPPPGTAAGCSQYEPKPPWQRDAGCAGRTMNDVAAVADQNTGVLVFYTNGTGQGWTVDGGTSVSAPIIAGMTGVVGGIPYSQGAAYLYRDYARNNASFNDVTTGQDFVGPRPAGCTSDYLCIARPQYDGPTGLGTPNGYPAPPPLPSQGYWMVASDGGIFPFGNALAHSYGSTGNVRLNKPIVGMTVTHDGNGYWLVASDGGLFPFGDAGGFGSTGNIRLNQPIVGMAPTFSGNGYWLVASDGGIFPFGDAVQHSYGSTGGIHLNRPIVGMAPTPDGNGYWLVASDGGIFPFGDAGGLGSTGNIRLNQPIVAMAATASGAGYWLVASDGGIFPFGDAVQHSYGSTGGMRLNKPIVTMAATPSGNGYWLIASDGGVFPFGDALGLGSTGNIRLNQPIVGGAASLLTCGC